MRDTFLRAVLLSCRKTPKLRGAVVSRVYRALVASRPGCASEGIRRSVHCRPCESIHGCNLLGWWPNWASVVLTAYTINSDLK